MEFIIKNNIIKYDEVADILYINKKCKNTKNVISECGIIKYICEKHAVCGIRLHNISKIKERKFSTLIKAHNMYFNGISARNIKEYLNLWKTNKDIKGSELWK